MATPQWVLVQKRLEPREKTAESVFERNSRKRQNDAVKYAIKKGFLKSLDQKIILENQISDCNVEELGQVLYISLPSSSLQSIDDLTILSCSRLKIVNLPHNYISDISAFYSCMNLIKLDLSGNQIVDLPQSNFWASLQSLKVLYLNNNMIIGKENILSLGGCNHLQILTLYDNPVALLPSYRHIAVNCILSLKALDYHVISDQEIIENLHLSGKFRPYARSFHMLLYQPVEKNEELSSDLSKVHKLLLSLDRIIAHYSPVVIIQRWVRGWITRKRLLGSNNPHIRAIVQHRQRGRDEVYKIIRRALSRGTTPGIKGHVSRLGKTQSCDQPPPPPCSPIPRHKYPKSLNQSWPTAKRGQLKPPGTADLQKAIQTTKAVLKEGQRQREKKRMKLKNKTISHTVPQTNPKTDEDQFTDTIDLCIEGEHQHVSLINKVCQTQQIKREDGKEIRKAEKDIKEFVSELKQPAKVDLQKIRPSKTKDTHTFTRAHTTMALSTLNNLYRSEESKQKANDLEKKASLVAQVKKERETRKERILEYQQMIKDAVLSWRIEEEARLEREKEKIQQRQEESLMKKAISLEAMAEAVQKRKEGERFAYKFRQQQTMINETLGRGERRLLKESAQQSIDESVRSTREQAKEQHEIVKTFMKIREEKLRNDSTEAKNKLNTQMIRIASQQLLEAKQKVARERARKKTSKESTFISSITDDDKKIGSTDLSDVLQTIPEAEMLSTGLLGPLFRAVESKDGNSPRHMRGTTHESHRTWQRGSYVVKGDHFPEIIPVKNQTPLMYDKLHPLPYLHNVGTTPMNSTEPSVCVMRDTPIISPHNNLYISSEQDSQWLQKQLQLMTE